MTNDSKQFSIDGVMQFFKKAREDIHSSLSGSDIPPTTLLYIDKRIARITEQLFDLKFPDNSLVASRHIKGNKINVYGSTLDGDAPYFYIENEGTDDEWCSSDDMEYFDDVAHAFNHARECCDE